MYNRQQLFFLTVSSILLLIFLLTGLGLIRIPGYEAGNSGDTGVSASKEEIEKSSSFLLESTPGLGDKGLMDTATGYADYSEDERVNIHVYETFNRGVVNITTETLSLNWFLEPVPQEGGTGSGSIIDRRGYILTNYHVVEKAYKVFINLYDGSQYEGEVIGKDPENDLAVLKFDPGEKALVTINFGSSSNLKVGQKVLAIGNPFGYDRTLTTGIVSGLGRPVRSRKNLIIRDMIQTDASINPGNSGGPLLDREGKMIGINTMIYSPSGGSVGIGFAVPVDTARRVVPELIESGHVRRGWIDLIPVQLEPSIVRYAELSVSRGLMVSRIVPGGNADRAGIRGGDPDKGVRYGRSIIYLGGDIIVEVDGMKTDTLGDLFSALEDNRPGETVEVELLRGRSRKRLEVVLAERPEGLEW
jgi:S1-C subfamily serine protease